MIRITRNTDGSLSVATGRPPHYPHRSKVFEQARWLISRPEVAKNDYRIMATFEYEEIARESTRKFHQSAHDWVSERCELILDSIQDETSRMGMLSDDWESQVESRSAAIDDWYARWEPIGSTFTVE